MADERLEQQIRFILEIDALKGVLRRSYLRRGDRPENSAEHSWHVAVMAVLLAEHANERVDTSRVVRMLLVHDVVEVDAGDTYVYDTAGAAGESRARGAGGGQAVRVVARGPGARAARALGGVRGGGARPTRASPPPSTA